MTPASRSLALALIGGLLAAAPASAEFRTQFRIGGEAREQCRIEASCGHNDRCTGLDLNAPLDLAETASLALSCNGEDAGRTIRLESLNGSAMRGEITGAAIPYLAAIGDDAEAQAFPIELDIRSGEAEIVRISTPASQREVRQADTYRDIIRVVILP